MEDPKKFREQLYNPLPGSDYDRVAPEVIENELDAFMGLMNETR